MSRYRRFRSRISSGFRRGRGATVAQIKKAVAASNRARARWAKVKQKKTIKLVAIVGILAAAGWFFRDKLKALLKIGG